MGLLSGDTLGPLAVAVLIFLLLLDLMHRRSRWAPRYPPGPTPLPVLGNLLQVDFEDPRPSFNQGLSPSSDVTATPPRRVQQEIDDVIGKVRRPEMGDQALMPFTVAVVHEVLRFADIALLGMPHMTSRDIEVQGFHVPKGTTLITNLSSVLKVETIWEKPFRFHPEHFLDALGRFVKQEAFIPFSAGRRACLGEPLARMELFLFFTSLLQHFSFLVPAGQPRPNDHGVFAFLVTPAPYQLCVVPH
ncbi:cytochrome P450 2D14-like [Budorcas taxicolor]|uniref:cytochrome P450 2D14-like n=1 Tax=Budorcas taxicolor TaxID=37181 RepID=UPI002284E9DB|nr:cytochrome P450 2D14-like [Budorcas taxicolor]